MIWYKRYTTDITSHEVNITQQCIYINEVPPLQLTHLLAAGMMQVTDPLLRTKTVEGHHTGEYHCTNCEHLECYPNTVFKCGKD